MMLKIFNFKRMEWRSKVKKVCKLVKDQGSMEANKGGAQVLLENKSINFAIPILTALG